MSTLAGRTCRSNLHTEPVPAITVGTFDCSAVNGRTPEPDSAYCLKCAAELQHIGYFTPNDPADVDSLQEHFIYLAYEAPKGDEKWSTNPAT